MPNAEIRKEGRNPIHANHLASNQARRGTQFGRTALFIFENGSASGLGVESISDFVIGTIFRPSEFGLRHFLSSSNFLFPFAFRAICFN